MQARIELIPRLLRARSFWLLLAFVLLAFCVWSFFHLAAEIQDGDTRAFDREVLLALRSPTDPAQPLGPRWLMIAARDFTALGSITVLATVATAVGFYLVMLRRWVSFTLVALSLGGGLVAMPLLKSNYDRPRPDLAPHGVEVYTQSFPSGHAMLAAAVYLTLGAMVAQSQPRHRLAAYVISMAILLTILIGLSRVFLAVHWPSDVLGGWSIGAAWALLCWLTAFFTERRLRKRQAVTSGDA